MGERTEEKHLIVGAGFCGLGVMSAFARAGIPFDAIEAEDDLGGNWRHGVYETVHIISSRKTTEYAELPMPAGWPDFPSAPQMLEYLRSYAEKFSLRERISFRTRAVRIGPEGAGGERWRATLERGGIRETRLYKGVVVCNGHHWDKRLPECTRAYAGELLHSKDYKKPEVLRGKRVLVIGGGNSACDIAVEAARFADAAHISMRRGYWFMPKTMCGIPTVELLKPWMPLALQRAILRSLLGVIVGRYESYGLQHPDHKIFAHHPTINSELLYFLRHGSITPHPDVLRFEGKTAEFADGTRAEFDLVVAATGYHVSWPFLEEGLVRWKDGMPQLVGGVMLPDRRGLYLFGVGQPRYGAGPLVSAGAALLAEVVRTQEKLDEPVGALLEALGARPMKSYLQDPTEVLRKAKLGRRLVPRLPALAPLLRARMKRRASSRAESRHA